jgi:hypothetical protein
MVYREWLFKIVSVLCLFIGAYHVVGIFYPINSSPPLRHGVFVGVCLICAYGFIKRSKFFIYFFSALLVQQFISHGGSLITQWFDYRELDWISLLILIFMPFVLINLFIDLKASGV